MNLIHPSEPPRPAGDVDLDSLLSLVAESLGYTCAFAPDGALLTLGGAGKEIPVRLTGLRREARRRARQDWPALASAHLAHALADVAQPDPCDLEQVRSLLGIRVEAVDELPDLTRVVGRHLGADLVELLTVHGRPVRPEEAGCWPIPSAQALRVALANTRRRERLRVVQEDLSGIPVWRLSGATEAAASHLRWLADYLPVPRDGVLAVLPGADTALIHPVRGLGAVRAIERLRLHALRADGPSDQVHWWHGDTLTRIRADLVVKDGQTRLVVAPPKEFAQVLARLAG